MPYSLSPSGPLPIEGYRKLSMLESARRAASFACRHALGIGVCQGQVHVNIFFDGTGNNRDWKENTTLTQEQRDKHSNIARLYNASIDDRDDGFFPFYIPGVGTPFDKIGDTSGWMEDYLGNGAGYMGADRINWAIMQIFNAVHIRAIEGNHALFDDATAATLIRSISAQGTGTESALRAMLLGHWEDKLRTALRGAQRKITSINVAVFGFSRGAALARTFAHWMQALLTSEDGGYTFAAVPFRLYFMGLFDTVASVGNANLVPGFNGHMGWADGTQAIPELVEQCVHYVALHEQRACFPLELAANVKQVPFPGMHSDVGGGYLPTEQGKRGHLSQIPLNEMHFEAMKAGVPLLSREEINERPTLKQQFDVPPELTALYNAYWEDNGIDHDGNDVPSMIQQHTHQYLQWRQAAPAISDLRFRDFYAAANGDEQKALKAAQDDLHQQVCDVHKRLQPDVAAVTLDVLSRGPVGAAWDYRPVSPTVKTLYEAVTTRARLPESVNDLFNHYVHDSRAGFRVARMMEPREVTGGYLRYRTVYHNSREVLPVATPDAANPMALNGAMSAGEGNGETIAAAD